MGCWRIDQREFRLNASWLKTPWYEFLLVLKASRYEDDQVSLWRRPPLRSNNQIHRDDDTSCHTSFCQRGGLREEA